MLTTDYLSGTKACACGKQMILCHDQCAAPRFLPAIWPPPPCPMPRVWRCFGCGASEPAPDYTPPTQDELDRRRWENANAEIFAGK
jgi:hypothetical protein